MCRFRLAWLGVWLSLATALPAEPGPDARNLAGRIDRHLAARWAEEQVKPVGRSDDAEFLRRVFLDLTGKIPPVAELRRFLADKSPSKRRDLVECLAVPGVQLSEHLPQLAK